MTGEITQNNNHSLLQNYRGLNFTKVQGKVIVCPDICFQSLGMKFKVLQNLQWVPHLSKYRLDTWLHPLPPMASHLLLGDFTFTVPNVPCLIPVLSQVCVQCHFARLETARVVTSSTLYSCPAVLPSTQHQQAIHALYCLTNSLLPNCCPYWSEVFDGVRESYSCDWELNC